MVALMTRFAPPEEADRQGTPADQRGRGAARQARRDERHGREERLDRGEPAAGGVDRQALHRPRAHAARPDPGGQPRADPRRREVRLAPRLQVLDLRDVVDPPGHHARAGRPVAHDPHPRAHGRADEPRRPGAARSCRRTAATRRRRRSPPRSRCRPSRSRRSSSSVASPCRSRLRSGPATVATHGSPTSSRTRPTQRRWS